VLLRKSQELLLPHAGTLRLVLLRKSQELLLSHGDKSPQVLQHMSLALQNKSLALQSKSLARQSKSLELTHMSAQLYESLVHPQQVRLVPWPMLCS
jgi:hypothetical protein